MKRFVVSLLALLLLSGVSVAQRLSVSDVEVVPGTTASFALTVDVEEGVYSGFQFEMQFPATGFSTTGNATAANTWQGGTLFVGELNAGVGRVAALSTTDKPIPDGEMVIGTVEFVVGENVALGEYDVTISAFNFLDGTNYAPVADVTFKVKVVDALNVYLDENATAAPEAAQGVNVHVRRTINADSWSTIVLPFSMTVAQVKSAFGDDVELADFIGCDTQTDGEGNVTGIKVKFEDATSIEANHPYIIKVSEAVTEFTVEGVDIVPEEEPSVDCDRIGKGTSRDPFRYNSFIGTYVANTAVPEEDLFISENMGVAKPAAEFFDICLRRIAEPKESCIMIGDSLSSDMLGAKNASLDSVWFMPSGDVDRLMKEYDINHTASSFDELYLVLKEWAE